MSSPTVVGTSKSSMGAALRANVRGWERRQEGKSREPNSKENRWTNIFLRYEILETIGMEGGGGAGLDSLVRVSDGGNEGRRGTEPGRRGNETRMHRSDQLVVWGMVPTKTGEEIGRTKIESGWTIFFLPVLAFFIQLHRFGGGRGGGRVSGMHEAGGIGSRCICGAVFAAPAWPPLVGSGPQRGSVE